MALQHRDHCQNPKLSFGILSVAKLSCASRKGSLRYPANNVCPPVELFETAADVQVFRARQPATDQQVQFADVVGGQVRIRQCKKPADRFGKSALHRRNRCSSNEIRSWHHLPSTLSRLERAAVNIVGLLGRDKQRNGFLVPIGGVRIQVPLRQRLTTTHRSLASLVAGSPPGHLLESHLPQLPIWTDPCGGTWPGSSPG